MSSGETLEAESAEVMLGTRRFRLLDGQLYDAQSQPLALRAKSLQFLTYLIQKRGLLVSKSKLAEAVWPGLAVTDESISQCARDIRKYLGDDAHSILETFPKRGYRLNAETVRDLKNTPGSPTASILAIGGMALVFATFLIWSYVREQTHSNTPAALREVIAVLPFQFLGDVGTQEYIASGLAQDLTVRLAEVSGVQVLPSSLAFAIDADGFDAVSAAKSLGARYVVDGGVFLSEDELHISIELIDGKHGTLEWASSFEGPAAHLVDFRNQIAAQIASKVNEAISDKDLDRLQHSGTRNTQAFEEVLQGRRAAASFTQEGLLNAERHFRRAAEIDADYARAYAELAAIYAIRFENGWTVLSAADEEKALFFARKALDLDPDLWLAHFATGRLYSVIDNKDFSKSEFHLVRAMSLQPANDDARLYFGAIQIFQGKENEALAIIEPVLAAHPNPPFWYHLSLGHALFQAGRNEDAEQALNDCLRQMTSSPYCLRFQIANFGQMGRIDDAEWSIEEYAILGFKPSISAIMDLIPEIDPENISRLEHAFRAAGLPDQ